MSLHRHIKYHLFIGTFVFVVGLQTKKLHSILTFCPISGIVSHCDNFDDFAEQTLKFQTQNSINKYYCPFPSWNFQDVFSDSDKQTFVV